MTWLFLSGWIWIRTWFCGQGCKSMRHSLLWWWLVRTRFYLLHTAPLEGPNYTISLNSFMPRKQVQRIKMSMTEEKHKPISLHFSPFMALSWTHPKILKLSEPLRETLSLSLSLAGFCSFFLYLIFFLVCSVAEKIPCKENKWMKRG